MSNAVLKKEHDQGAKFTKFQNEDFTSISKFTKLAAMLCPISLMCLVQSEACRY